MWALENDKVWRYKSKYRNGWLLSTEQLLFIEIVSGFIKYRHLCALKCHCLVSTASHNWQPDSGSTQETGWRQRENCREHWQQRCERWEMSEINHSRDQSTTRTVGSCGDKWKCVLECLIREMKGMLKQRHQSTIRRSEIRTNRAFCWSTGFWTSRDHWTRPVRLKPKWKSL